MFICVIFGSLIKYNDKLSTVLFCLYFYTITDIIDYSLSISKSLKLQKYK